MLSSFSLFGRDAVCASLLSSLFCLLLLVLAVRMELFTHRILFLQFLPKDMSMFARFAKGAQRVGAVASQQKGSLFGYSLLGGLYGAGALATYNVFADDHVHPPHQHWPHSSMLGSYDHAR